MISVMFVCMRGNSDVCGNEKASEPKYTETVGAFKTTIHGACTKHVTRHFGSVAGIAHSLTAASGHCNPLMNLSNCRESL